MAYLITVDGIVQGVGFRPFVYKLAHSMDLKGYVINSTFGVIIHLECDEKDLNKFLKQLKKDAPINSKILDISIEKTTSIELQDFTIDRSIQKHGITLIPPDIAICEDCTKEIFDQNNRRFLYPFTNCTNCGPRYSIIKNIPYDREKTTMSTFAMCDTCKKEYSTEEDRRFHAQPNCCPVCGPNVYIGKLKGIDAIIYCARLIDNGEIVAIKGLGGYHLICDAKNEAAINRLRELKKRNFKPLAVMVKNYDTIKRYLNQGIKRFFDTPEAPVVITEAKDILPKGISPLNNKIGFMKAYTPLHQILFHLLKTDFLVATSGNLKDEPIVIDEKNAEKKLSIFTKYFLHHNRPIHNRVDDSVFTIFNNNLYPIRLSRGYAPLPIITKVFYKDSLFGAGAHLKNHFALTKGKYILLSQFIGDLYNAETADFYEETFQKLTKLFEIAPKKVITDLHPDYFSTKFAESFAEKNRLSLIKLQHHKAHLYSIMAEQNITDNIIGVIFDGTGIGEDGAIWGGEIFYKKGEIKRRFHLKYFKQPGGDASAKAPYKMLLGYLLQVGCDEYTIKNIESIFDVHGESELLKNIIQKSINSPYTSSAGRLFEAIGSFITSTKINEYEGHAAIALEALAKPTNISNYSYKIEEDEIDITPMFEEIVSDYFKNKPKETIAFKFHKTIAQIIHDCCNTIKIETGIDTVLFSGGVFQNLLLLKLSIDLLKSNGFKPIHHQKLPPNDASIALGQVYYGGIA